MKLSRVENKRESKLNYVITNNGLELLSKEFSDFYKEKGFQGIGL